MSYAWYSISTLTKTTEGLVDDLFATQLKAEEEDILSTRIFPTS